MDDTVENIDDEDFISYEDYGSGIRGTDDVVLIELIRCLSALYLRIGYILVQTGCIPVENIYVIIFYNVLEIGISVFSYGIIGVYVAYGFKTVIFQHYWGIWSRSIMATSVTGSCAVLVGTAQMSTFLVGRIRLLAAISLIVVYCSLFQPFLMYLVWSPKSLFKQFHIRMRNPGYTLVAYIPSTIVGLTGSLFLGRRLVRIKDVDEFSVANQHAVGTTLGYFMIILGYTILGLPVKKDQMALPHKVMKAAARMLVNNMLAVSTGIITTSILYFLTFREIYKYWTILRCIQGGVAGMMTILAATDYTGLWNVFLMAAIGSALFFISTLALHNTALEDNCNMTTSHLICGVLGALTWPLFEGLFDSKTLWQMLYLLTIIIMTVVFAVIMFAIFNATGILRNECEVSNHKRAMNVLSHLPDKGYLERLFMIVENKTPHIIPGSYRKRYIPDNKLDSKGINMSRDAPKTDQGQTNKRKDSGDF